ncbi:MAG: hypothetical protein K2K55_04825 [Duncaniella sp.]|nr:hypothetical protein [Duncaniella sp.]
MNTVGIICSIIAAITGAASLIIAILTRRDSKRNLVKQIEKKDRQINEFDNRLFRQFGASYSGRGSINPLEEKKRRLQSEIDYLKKML